MDNKIKVPNLGRIKVTNKLRFKGQIKSVVTSKKADRCFASISVKSLAVSSQGEIFKEAKPHTQKLMRLKQLSRSLFCKKSR